jgi:hypothetical protein
LPVRDTLRAPEFRFSGVILLFWIIFDTEHVMSKKEERESAADWRKASYSIANGSCAEVGTVPGAVMVRDSVSQDGLQIRFPASAWQEFTARVKGSGSLTLSR